MEGINTRFILSTEERESSIVSVNLYQNKYWIITKYDTGKSIYELNCDEIVDCKIRKRAAMLSSEEIDKDERDEGIVEEADHALQAEVVISTSRKSNIMDETENKSLEFNLQPLIKDAKKSFLMCQKLTEDILKSTLTESTNFMSNANENRKRILILSNPKSGKGNAKELTEDIVLPLIKDRSINYDLIITKRAYQACNFVANYPSLLHRYSSIAIVSGDGLVYEIYQGLITRPEWELACKMPIAIIPGGSGNGLAKSVVHFQDKEITSEKNYVKHCTTNLVDGSPRPMDMMCIQTNTGKSYLSFLSFSWGFGAEVDIESEKIRFVGGARFTIWSLYSLLKMNSSQAKISYKKVNVENNIRGRVNHEYFKKGRKRLQESETSTSSNTSNDTGIQDGSDSNLGELDSTTTFPLATSITLDSSQSSGLKEILKETPINTNLSTSDGWTTIEDKFVMVMVLSKPWLAADICMAPQFNGFDDGVMWLIMVRKGISRRRMLQVMMGFWDGSHLQYPEAEMIPVTAVRLEPQADSGIMMVDGEQIEYGPIQAEVLPSFANIVY